MTSAEKIEYVRKSIEEEAAINPSGPFHLTLYTVTDEEEGPTLLYRYRQ